MTLMQLIKLIQKKKIKSYHREKNQINTDHGES